MGALSDEFQALSADLLQEFGVLAVLADPNLAFRANPDTGSIDALEEFLVTEGGERLTTEGGDFLVLEGSLDDPTESYDVYVYEELKKRRNGDGTSDVRYARFYVSGLNLPEITTRFVLTIGERVYSLTDAAFVKAEGEVAIYILEAAI
jgi:hypothetical protein